MNDKETREFNYTTGLMVRFRNERDLLIAMLEKPVSLVEKRSVIAGMRAADKADEEKAHDQ
jgi:hypothetical protein